MAESRTIVAVAAAVLLFASPAAALDPNAVRHFERGKQLRDAGRCSEAVPEFDKSVKTEPSIGAYYNLGFCHSRLGNSQLALTAFINARDLARRKDDDRLYDINAAIALLLERPHITLTFPAARPLPEGLEIDVDGTVLPRQHQTSNDIVVFTSAMDNHEVVVRATGFAPRTLTVPVNRAAPVELTKPAEPALAPAPTPSPDPPRSAHWTWQHYTGVGLLAAGVGGIVIGAVEGLSYLHQRSALDRQIEDHPCYRRSTGNFLCPAGTSAADRSAASKLVKENADLESGAALPILLPIAVGAVAATVGVIVLSGARSPSSSSSQAVLRLQPWAGRSQHGLSVMLTF